VWVSDGGGGTVCISDVDKMTGCQTETGGQGVRQRQEDRESDSDRRTDREREKSTTGIQM
jgi:hypothetical protein